MDKNQEIKVYSWFRVTMGVCFIVTVLAKVALTLAMGITPVIDLVLPHVLFLLIGAWLIYSGRKSLVKKIPVSIAVRREIFTCSYCGQPMDDRTICPHPVNNGKHLGF